jgi:Glucosamine 6-phosphate synthetase, contains amidotransferase and phosphosugar isomerase domains
MPAFEHEMLREINEQPEALRNTIVHYVERNVLKPEFFARLAGWQNPAGEIVIAASGSSRHSGLYGEILLEDLCGFAVDVEYASEYSLRGRTDPRRPSVLVLSQSGETSDTLAALKAARQNHQRTLAITNHPASTIANLADVSMPLHAGEERSIPATKSFTCQLAALYLIAMYEGARLYRINANELQHSIQELEALPGIVQASLDSWSAQGLGLAGKYKDASTFLFLGRGIHYAIAREGALKLKEASYIHAEGYPAGELKHGPNALVSERVPLVVLATVDRALESSVLRHERTLQLLRDVKAEGGRAIVVANEDDARIAELANDVIRVSPVSEYLLPILEVIPLQLFAYFMAREYRVNVDRPRNLSKAVVDRVQSG